MKFGKVAICMSGLVRTGIEAFPAFRHFFQDLNADVFYHTWSSEESKLDQLNYLYKPKKFIVTSPKKLSRMASFQSMLFSIMMANEVKKDYEIENNFRYDMVIKTRFDLVFYPGNCFPEHPLIPRTIFCPGGNLGINHIDYELHGINDVIFWGDSESMDIATNAYFYYKYTCVENQIRFDYGQQMDPRYTFLSPGNLIYQNFIKNNIASHRFVPYIGEIPWREDIKHLHPIYDYELIKKRYEQS